MDIDTIPQTVAQVVEFFSDVGKIGTIAVDTETTGLKPSKGDRACGYSFSKRTSKSIVSIYIPLRHTPKQIEASLFDDNSSLVNLDIPQVNAVVKKVLEDPNIVKVYHHAKFDLQVFWAEGIFPVNYHCTMLMSNLIDSRRPNGLKKLMEILLGESHVEQDELFMYLAHNEIKKGDGYHLVAIDITGKYACKDTNATLRVYEKLLPDLEPVKDIYEIERRAIDPIAKMEWRGLPADKEYLHKIGLRIQKAADNVKAAADKLVGRPVDIGSAQEIANILYKDYKVPIPRLRFGKTPTDKEALEKIEHPFARLVTSYRQLSKLASTYLLPMANLVHTDGRIHCSFQQVKSAIESMGGREERSSGADTGRLASYDPNLQNLTTRRKVYKNGKPEIVEQTLVRRAFKVPGPEWQFLMLDFNQMELRVLAHESQDKTLLAAYNKPKADDIHKITASKVFKVKWERALANKDEVVLKTLRTKAKSINFGIIYGMGAERLAEELELITTLGEREGLEEGRRLLRVYFETYPGVKDLDEYLKDKLKCTGYVETMYGRRRFLKPEDEYKALNTRIQSGCADMNKIALYQVEQELLKGNFKSTLINNIHDEICILHYKEEPITQLVKSAMQNFPGMRVPILAEVATAYPTWADKVEAK